MRGLYPDKGYINRISRGFEKVKIPKDHVHCPYCKGSGEHRVYWGQPGDRGQFENCFYCGGLGYVPKEYIEADNRLRQNLALDKFDYDIIFRKEGEQEE